ncbi:hypothetical protein [Bacillus thuringiensis]|uniref:hypothetical protein n=1 Tax=Bacillus thuringiensis TaxID=1428 RepID=UPI0037DC7983
MNKEQAFNFIENMYHDLLISFDITKIEEYLSEEYFKITDRINSKCKKCHYNLMPSIF